MKKKFEKIYNKNKKKVFMIAYSITNNYDDAMDIVQETFIKIYENLDNIDNYNSYIISVCKNLSLNYIKKHNRIIYTDSLPIKVQNSIEEEVENKMQLSKIHNFLYKLSKKERIVFSLKLYGGYSYEEIAKELNVSLSTVRQFYKRAIDKIKENFYV